MAALLPPAPVNPTGELAQHVPGYDPSPVIAAQEQSLQDFLNLPVREILERLGLPPIGDEKRPEDGQPPEAEPENAQPPANPMDPSALISPVTDALSTLGSGLFEGVDPTQMLGGISQALAVHRRLDAAVGRLARRLLEGRVGYRRGGQGPKGDRQRCRGGCPVRRACAKAWPKRPLKCSRRGCGSSRSSPSFRPRWPRSAPTSSFRGGGPRRSRPPTRPLR